MPGEAVFQVESWEEKPVRVLDDGAKITRAEVAQAYHGGIEGRGVVAYVMHHGTDGSATFVGYELLEATIDGRPGRLVLRHDGTFAGGVARSAWRVVEGAGSGALGEATGSGSFEAGHDMKATVRLDLSFG